MRTRRLAWAKQLFLPGVLCFALTGLATAATPAVERVEVSTPAAPHQPRVTEQFSKCVHREVARLDLQSARRYVLSASLTTLDAVVEGGRVKVRAQVSLTVRDQQSGNISALLSGRASTFDASAERSAARQLVMEAAVRSAVRRLPDAVE